MPNLPRARWSSSSRPASHVVELVETAPGLQVFLIAGPVGPGSGSPSAVSTSSTSEWWRCARSVHGSRPRKNTGVAEPPAGRAPTVVELVETTPGPSCVHGREGPVRPRLGSSWLASGPPVLKATVVSRHLGGLDGLDLRGVGRARSCRGRGLDGLTARGGSGSIASWSRASRPTTAGSTSGGLGGDHTRDARGRPIDAG